MTNKEHTYGLIPDATRIYSPGGLGMTSSLLFQHLSVLTSMVFIIPVKNEKLIGNGWIIFWASTNINSSII